MINQVRTELKEAFKKGIRKSILALEKYLSKDSIKYDEFILIISRYEDVSDEINRDTISNADKNIELSKIRNVILSIINKLEIEDINKGDSLHDDKLEITVDYDLEEKFILDPNTIKWSISEDNEFGTLLLCINKSVSKVSNSFKNGSNQINKVVSSGNRDMSKIIEIDLRTAKDLNTYSDEMDEILKKYPEISTKMIRDFLSFVQIPDNTNIYPSIEVLKELLLSFKDIGKSTKNIRTEINGLNFDLKNIKSTETMRLAINRAVPINEKLIENMRELYFYIDKIEEELNHSIIKVEK